MALEARRLLAVVPAALPSFHFNAGGDWIHEAGGRSWSSTTGLFTGGHDVSVPPETTLYTATPAGNYLVDGAAAMRSARTGPTFDFAAPVPSGDYALWIELADLDATAVAGSNRFDISGEGQPIASDVDVVARAGASLTAIAISRDITITDGQLDLRFAADQGEAFVNAIVLVPLDVPAQAAPYGDENASETGRSVLAASDLRQIGLGVLLYSNNHRGHFPATLDLTVAEGDLDIDSLLDPRSDSLLPRGVLTTLEKTSWAARATDYVYVGAGLRNSSAPELPVAYENPASNAGDINVLYADGHVALLTRIDAAALLGFDAGTAPVHAAQPPLGLVRDPAISTSRINASLIAQALGTYANSHSNRMPPDLGTLLLGNYGVTIANFANPRLGHIAPDASTWTAQQQADWVNANSDYAKSGASSPLIQQLRKLTTLVYEKPTPALADGPAVVAPAYHAAQAIEPRWADELLAIDNGPIARDVRFDATGRAPEVRVRFSEYAGGDLTASDLQLFDADGNLAPGTAVTSVRYDPFAQTAIFTLSPSVLGRGHWSVKLAAGSVADASAKTNPFDATMAFSFQPGDANGDGVVNFTDLSQLARNYGSSGRTAAQGNVDFDEAGRVDFADLLLLARSYGQSVPPPPAAAQTSTATRSRRTIDALA